MPGSASNLGYDPQALESLDYKELQGLAIRIPGVARDEKNEAGKFVPKTVSELKAELVALHKTVADDGIEATQTLSGPLVSKSVLRRSASL